MREVLMQFRVAFRAISQHYHRVRKDLGVSGAQLWALAEVGAQRGITVGELASRLAVHQSTASNLVEALESAGLVERRRDSDDGRVVSLYASGHGKRLLRRAPKPLRGVLQQALCDLTVDSLRELNGNMQQLLARMHVSARNVGKTTLSDAVED
jgi:DNA-binding MarR family transcriptional regulator